MRDWSAWSECSVEIPASAVAGAMAVVFGLQLNDCEAETDGIFEQLKAEAMESDRKFLRKRMFR